MVSYPRVISPYWVAVPVLAALACPVTAQTGAPSSAPGSPGAVTQAPVGQAQPVETPAMPSLGQRIDPIVPPVQRVAPAMAPRAAAAPLVAPVRRQAAAGVKTLATKSVAVRTVPTAAVPAIAAPTGPAAAAQAATGVQAVGPAPTVSTRKKIAKSGLLTPNLRSALGRPPAAATKPSQPALSRLTAAARSAALRAKPKR